MWKQLLDRAHSRAQLDALAADAGAVAEALAQTIGPAATIADLEARDALFRQTIAEIDAVVSRAMRVFMDHALADDTSIASQTRNVFASTVIRYAHELSLLGQRARDAAERGGARAPDHVADLVVTAAQDALALGEAVAGPVLALASQLATASVAEVNRYARDRTRSDAERKKWSAARRDLEAIAAQPVLLRTAPVAARMAALEELIDEGEPEPEVSFADMIELD